MVEQPQQQESQCGNGSENREKNSRPRGERRQQAANVTGRPFRQVANANNRHGNRRRFAPLCRNYKTNANAVRDVV